MQSKQVNQQQNISKALMSTQSSLSEPKIEKEIVYKFFYQIALKGITL